MKGKCMGKSYKGMSEEKAEKMKKSSKKPEKKPAVKKGKK